MYTDSHSAQLRSGRFYRSLTVRSIRSVRVGGLKYPKQFARKPGLGTGPQIAQITYESRVSRVRVKLGMIVPK